MTIANATSSIRCFDTYKSKCESAYKFFYNLQFGLYCADIKVKSKNISLAGTSVEMSD